MPKYLTCVLSAVVLMLSLPPRVGAGDLVQEITSNEILELAARGDTLWMVTARGLNFTLGHQTPLRWQGYRTDDFLYEQDKGVTHVGLAFGDGIALFPSAPDENGENGILAYDHTSGGVFSVKIPWNKEIFPDSFQDSISLYTRDIVWTPSGFWIAAEHAGIAQLPIASIRTGILSPSVAYPGIDSLYAFNKFSPKNLGAPFDTTILIERIAATFDTAGTERIYALSASRIHRFTLSTRQWDTLGTTITNSGHTIERFLEPFTHRTDSGDLVLSICLVKNKGATSPTLCRYDTTSSTWSVVKAGVVDMSYGHGDTIYTVAGDFVRALSPANPDQTLEINSEFNRRMLEADPSLQVPSVNDIAFEPTSAGSAYFWIATSDGLYFSRDALTDEADGAAFTRENRAPFLEEGLSTTYFYPTILAPYQPKGYFAYNLAESAEVTIAVFDWNMDHVKTIIRDEFRRKGSLRRDGRSTEKIEDFWDGTDRNGRPVAPGVYYYKISSTKGERAFGKIVVAK